MNNNNMDEINYLIKNHKKKIELLQWAIISGISSLIYSEYIKNIKKKTKPIISFYVAEIKEIQNLLDRDGEFINKLSTSLIHDIKEILVNKKYFTAPEFILFDDSYIELLKVIFDIYIVPNIIKKIPETISIKFDLNNDNNQMIKESRDIHIFKNTNIASGNYYDYIVHQIVLQLLILSPSINKKVIDQKYDYKFFVNKDEIMTIDHKNAICPIHFDSDIMDNIEVMELLNFVTSTIVGINSTKYNIVTSPNNTVTLTTLGEIDYNKNINIKIENKKDIN